jgi:hypothetical protein
MVERLALVLLFGCTPSVAADPISHWFILGPFVRGKTEYDADPLASFGGIGGGSPLPSLHTHWPAHTRTHTHTHREKARPCGGCVWYPYPPPPHTHTHTHIHMHTHTHTHTCTHPPRIQPDQLPITKDRSPMCRNKHQQAGSCTGGKCEPTRRQGWCKI